MLRSAAGAIIVGTAVGCASAVGARIAAARHRLPAPTQGVPHTSVVHAADERRGWFVDDVKDTSELSPYATAIILDPRP